MSKIQDALKKIGGDATISGGPGSENAFTDLRDMDRDAPQLGDHEFDKRKIIYPGMRDVRVFNAFRDLRTSLRRAMNERNPIILVTSTTGSSGAGFISMNLGRAIALDDGVTSLIVDCNFKRPSFNSLLVDDNPAGLRDYIADETIAAADIIHPCGVKRLRVIPAGQREVEVTASFTSVRLRQLIDELNNRYTERNILVNAPPVSETADTRVLAEICDGVLLVVEYGKTSKAKIKRSIDAIGSEKLIGVVFNNERGLLV